MVILIAGKHHTAAILIANMVRILKWRVAVMVGRLRFDDSVTTELKCNFPGLSALATIMESPSLSVKVRTQMVV
jgi:hypothetical protein